MIEIKMTRQRVSGRLDADYYKEFRAITLAATTAIWPRKQAIVSKLKLIGVAALVDVKKYRSGNQKTLKVFYKQQGRVPDWNTFKNWLAERTKIVET